MGESDNKIYFCVSDIHGFATELKRALWEAGFRKTNKNHVLIVCGDVFDRGSEAIKVYDYLKSIDKNRLILIKGNHEQLYFDLLNKNYPEYHDFSNGTVSTFCQIADMTESPIDGVPMVNYLYHATLDYLHPDANDDVDRRWKAIKAKVAASQITSWMESDAWKNYCEIGKFVFVHGFIPEVGAEWRKEATARDWLSATWGCPWKQYLRGGFDREAAQGKILVCGHWHTEDFFMHLANDPSKHDDIFYLDNIIAIDGGVEYVDEKLVHKQNVLIIDKDKPYAEKLGQELRMAVKQRSADEGSWWVDPNRSSEDICLCAADCKKPCARKHKAVGLATYSDFSDACSDFEPEDKQDVSD